MSYSIDKIRNICLLGHGGNGKTSLAESMLFLTGATDRLGKASDGTTVSDFDAEEIRRKISIGDSAMYCDFNGVKINIIDTPGYFDFAGEVTSTFSGTSVALITHAGVIRALLGHWRGLPLAEWTQLRCDFGSLTEVNL